MITHGYRLMHNAGSAPADYIPSLIGIDEQQVNPDRRDIYFESFAPLQLTVRSLSITRWVSYDSPGVTRDPILGVKSDKGSFHIPLSEFKENATDDAEAWALVVALKTGQPHG